MNMRKTEPDDLPPLAQEALGWLVRLTSGAATTDDATAFERWRAQGPAHADAFHEAVAMRRALRAMPLARIAPRDNVVRLRPRSNAMTRRAVLVGGGAVAASAAAMVVAPPFELWPSLAELGAGERTGPGERRTLQPMAGVTLEMNARTALSLTDAGARLVSGEAFVALRGQTPFAITVGDEVWSGRRAEFNIRTSARETCITCASGSLSREADGQTIAANQRYAVRPDAPGSIAQVDAALGGAWRRGLLIFRNTPLAEVVESINRYWDGRILLAGDSIADRPVSGMFHTAQIGNAVEQLQQLLQLQVTRLAGNVVILR